uniref:Uncharacterized protein n=1 Tax=Rhizophora mucronata TaxID=61149 RepID=A0A2P2QBX2_RHIMU
MLYMTEKENCNDGSMNGKWLCSRIPHKSSRCRLNSCTVPLETSKKHITVQRENEVTKMFLQMLIVHHHT